MMNEPVQRAAQAMTVPSGMFGPRILDLADRLATHSEMTGGLTCTYLSRAHRAVAKDLQGLMQGAGLDTAIDAVGNVTGRYRSASPGAKALIVGSHYDTVVNAGRYDGRLGILTALVVAEELRRTGQALPFHLDIIAFAEEEGVRFSAPYIGSSVIAGRFDRALLQRHDANGTSLQDALREVGSRPEDIAALARRPQDLLGYLEVHIEQGPVLLNSKRPAGIVTAIAGGARHRVIVQGRAGHAGTVPMTLRYDAAAAAAEMVLAVERRCSAEPGVVGTVGKLAVLNGAINVIPAFCELTLDIRASEEAVREAAERDVIAEVARISARRGVTADVVELSRTPAVSFAPRLQALMAQALARAGVEPLHLPSGAGHDAVMFAGLTEIGMLFVRCGNGGISHDPRETVTADDADVGARVLLDVILNLA
jgi:beta-ureidopropionase / N-carbamoyl-L-amino-acid hydrolase